MYGFRSYCDRDDRGYGCGCGCGDGRESDRGSECGSDRGQGKEVQNGYEYGHSSLSSDLGDIVHVAFPEHLPDLVSESGNANGYDHEHGDYVSLLMLGEHMSKP